MRISRFLFLFPLLMASPAMAQEKVVPPAFVRGEETESFDPDLELPKLVRMQVEFIEMSHEKLTSLLENRADSDDSALRLQVRELIAKKEAKILETFVATGKSGQKVRSQSADEFTYPTEYEPMQIIEKPDEKSPIPQAIKAPFCPTAFETRNLGSSVEFEPTLSEDAKVIELRLLPEMTWLTERIVWAEDKDPLGNVSKIEMPRFYCLKTDTSVTCQAGKPLFIAALSPKSDKGEIDTDRKVMVFVKCEVITLR